jgi:hypothetical protein
MWICYCFKKKTVQIEIWLQNIFRDSTTDVEVQMNPMHEKPQEIITDVIIEQH